MFTRWGELVHKFRYTVLGVAVAALLALGAYGFGLDNHLSSSGWFDPGAESSQAAVLKDQVYGRDHMSDVITLYTAPAGKTIDDPEFGQKITDSLNNLPKEHPDQIAKVNLSYWKTETGDWSQSTTGSKDKKYAFATIAIKGDDDTAMVNNYRAVKDAFYIPGIDVQVAGLQPVAGTLNDTIASDQQRMEILAIPLVGILLFFIFGGVVAAALPLIIGGLTVLGARGIVMAITNVTEVNSFVGAVVSMIGLGLAIDYGLFIVSRFREEMAEGYTTRQAVRRSVMTAGRTVVFSATMIIAASAGMLIFPQGFLKSVAYGTIATVLLAAVASLTILPAMLSILGKRVDALGLKRFRKTKTAEEVENGFWGRTTQWVMKHPLKVAVPLCIILLLLIIPVKNLKFGGISETYLPPDNPTRVAQEKFDSIFPLRQTDPVQLVITTDNTSEIKPLLDDASNAPGLAHEFGTPGIPPNNSNVWVSETTLAPDANIEDTLAYLRTIPVPDDVQLLVGGQPVLMQDSITSLLDRMPLMIIVVVLVTTLLMFLTFGSLVLPIKAALMSALGLGSTLGILTWIFVDGHGAGLLNFTPQPIMSPVLVLIMAIIYGLSTDYEVFLLSRMVEARAQGASTTEAVRSGTAQTGRIITAAALILLVVVGAFAFSDLVMMQYIAYGMMAALFIDATVLRMLLVPATMKLLGDDCWWAPAWMKRVQQRVGLGEPILDDERPGSGDVVDLVKTTPVTDPVTMQLPQMPDGTVKGPKKPRRLKFLRVDPEAPTEQLARIDPDMPPPSGAPGKPRRATHPEPETLDTDSPDESPADAAPSETPKRKRRIFRRAGADADMPVADSGAGRSATEPGDSAAPAPADDAGDRSTPSASGSVPSRPTSPPQTSGKGAARVLPPERSNPVDANGVIGAVEASGVIGPDEPGERGGLLGIQDTYGPGATGTPGSAPSSPTFRPPEANGAGASDARGGFGPAAAMRAAGPAEPLRPEPPRPDSTRPQPPRTDIGRSEGPRPETSRPDVPRPETSRADTARPEASRPETSRAGAAWPETSRADANRADPARPGTPHADAARHEASRPDTTGPETVRPEFRSGGPRPDTRSGGPRPDTTWPDTTSGGPRPDTTRPDARSAGPRPDTTFGGPRPDTTRPDAPRPDVPRPGPRPDATRGEGRPDMARPTESPSGRYSGPPAVSVPGADPTQNRGVNQPPQVVRPGMPPRTVPASEAPTEATDPVPPAEPSGTTPRVLPPKPSKLPPHPSVRAQLYRPDAPPYHPGAESEPGPTGRTPAEAAPQQADPSPWVAPENHVPSVQLPRRVPAEQAPAAPPENLPVDDGTSTPATESNAGPGGDNRNDIEQWMADLRSSRRRPESEETPEDPEDPKHRNSGRTVSVNELLRRQNRD
ncbi:MMPL family transporter [Nocardia nova]|uniref:MMPL family transporter n=1 Tax=Nocardia nova TaxID=37330 RepID=UPI003F53FBB2